MNKNKIIFAILGIILLGLLILLVTNLTKSQQNTNTSSAGWAFRIWILEDEVGKFQEYMTLFKDQSQSYKNKEIMVESFSDVESYKATLTAAFLSGNGPDIFLLNNSENSPLENQIMGIDPAIVSPNDFRLRFKPVFGSDLIITDENDSTIEFLKWIPAGYETLWVFYNRKYFLRPSELNTWTDFAKEIKSIWEKYNNIIPLAIWNGATVTRVGDIMQNLFVAEGWNSLTTTTDSQTRQVLEMYKQFGDRNGDNKYNILYEPSLPNMDINFFTEGRVAAMIWYPRDLIKIDAIGYQKNFLFATPFPRLTGAEKSLALHYNYFVINKDSLQSPLALDIVKFISTTQWQQAYIDIYPYYLSPEVSVFSEMWEKKILPQYNIVYKNFGEEDALLVSYNVGNNSLFHKEVWHILDLTSGYEEKFSVFKDFTTCVITKQTSLLNLSSPCKK